MVKTDHLPSSMVPPPMLALGRVLRSAGGVSTCPVTEGRALGLPAYRCISRGRAGAFQTTNRNQMIHGESDAELGLARAAGMTPRAAGSGVKTPVGGVERGGEVVLDSHGEKGAAPRHPGVVPTLLCVPPDSHVKPGPVYLRLLQLLK